MRIVRLRGRSIEELPGSAWRWLLAPAWLGYRPAVGLRNALFDCGARRARHLPVPVVSIGNLTAGGTGKTPATLLVARLLLARGARPAVLSRGYRGDGERNDEAQLMEGVPVVCDPDRLRGGRRAISPQPVGSAADCLLLDDGFQHRQLHRDLDIVLIDATDPWGGGAVLPLGRLREGRSALRRAGLLWLTRADLVPSSERDRLIAELSRIGPPVLRADQGPGSLSELHTLERRAPADLSGPILLVSGIGNPRAFELTALRDGLSAVASLRFPDHHRYTRADAELIRVESARLGAQVVMTPKDRVKLEALMTAGQPPRMWALESATAPDPASLAVLETLLATVVPRGHGARLASPPSPV